MTQEANRESTSAQAKPLWFEILIKAGVAAALESELNPNVIDEGGFTLMELAAHSISPNNLRKLVAAGGNILLENDRGETILHTATSHSLYGTRLDVVTYILNELDTNHKESKLSFINKQSDSGETALMEATCSIGRRSCDTVQKIQDSFKTQLLLLENGANPSIVSNEEHPESFLQNFISAHYGNKHIFSRLEKKGISSDLKEYLDSGSFDVGFKEVLAKAIENGLDINVKSGMHNTPIVQALQYCNIPLFKTLKELGAVKPGAEDGLTYTPNCDDSNNVAKMQCFIDNYDAIENCEDSVKPAAEQAPVQDEL